MWSDRCHWPCSTSWHRLQAAEPTYSPDGPPAAPSEGVVGWDCGATAADESDDSRGAAGDCCLAATVATSALQTSAVATSRLGPSRIRVFDDSKKKGPINMGPVEPVA
jgi:hypothetical protein